jgi:hypothetical protein
MAIPKDWRLSNQERYLKGAKISWNTFHAIDSTDDHAHCAFCWAKFMKGNSPGGITEGFATVDKKHWICKSCYENFKEVFQWQNVDGVPDKE